MRHPREIDEALVDAYRARRALDYLVGFTLSPVLWRKLPGARSAGRVQSVALRIVCDRELEIEKFVAREYWSIVAHLRTEANAPFTARLVGADGKKINRLDVGSGAEAEAFKTALENGALLGRGDRIEAGQAPPLPALHHLDLAAGGVAQARPRAGAHHADRPAPLRGRRRRRRRRRPHHLYAHRRRRSRARGGRVGAPGHRQGFRRRLRAGRAAQIHRQGQERAGSARGDPSDRHDAAPARRRPPSRARAGQALRAHLDAHHRLPDGERRARAHDGRHSGRSGRAQARLPRHRPGRALSAVSSPSTRRAATTRRTRSRAACRRCAKGEKLAKERIDASPAFHRAAAPLHRGDAGQADGGARHRPALDLRLDHRGAARIATTCGSRRSGSFPRTRAGW